MKKKEIRAVKIELREIEEGKKLRGMPIVYNKESEYMGFVEIIEPGAATEALRNSDAVALYGHNSDTLLPLGRMSAGTLRATETDQGVEVEIDPPPTVFASDLKESVKRGDLNSMSFAFIVEDDRLETRNGIDFRVITKFREIMDFSIVTYPAYPDTSVALRSIEQHKQGETRTEQDTANSIQFENENIDIDLLINKTGATK